MSYDVGGGAGNAGNAMSGGAAGAGGSSGGGGGGVQYKPYRGDVSPLRTSPSIEKLAGAFAKAQGEFPPIEKTLTADTGSYTYKYAPLSAILAGVLPALSKHEIAFWQPTHVREDGITVLITILVHSSGQWIMSEYLVGTTAHGHQKLGGSLTYARRYAAQSILGVSAEDDLDETDKPEDTKQKPTRTVVQGSDPTQKKPLPPGKGEKQLTHQVVNAI